MGVDISVFTKKYKVLSIALFCFLSSCTEKPPFFICTLHDDHFTIANIGPVLVPGARDAMETAKRILTALKEEMPFTAKDLVITCEQVRDSK